MEHRRPPSPLSAAVLPVPPDYPQLVAGIGARQAASPTAGLAARLDRGPATPPADTLAALAIVARGQPGWGRAAEALGASFHPRVARMIRGTGP